MFCTRLANGGLFPTGDPIVPFVISPRFECLNKLTHTPMLTPSIGDLSLFSDCLERCPHWFCTQNKTGDSTPTGLYCPSIVKVPGFKTYTNAHPHNLMDLVCGIPPMSSYYLFSFQFLSWGTGKERETCWVLSSPLCQYPTSGLLCTHTHTHPLTYGDCGVPHCSFYCPFSKEFPCEGGGALYLLKFPCGVHCCKDSTTYHKHVHTLWSITCM